MALRVLHLLLLYLQYTLGVDLLAEVGKEVQLPCPVDPGTCGQVHSIKWYKDDLRIFVFSEAAQVSRAESGYADRVEVEYTRNKSDSLLLIKSARVEDEGMYRCEITYVEVSDACQAVHHVNFTTLIKPESLRMFREGGEVLNSGSRLRDITEDEEISLICEAGPAKPIPLVQWINGTTVISGEMEREEKDGLGTGRAKVRFPVGRGDLGVDYECRAYHPSLRPTGFISSKLRLDVDVRPKELKMKSVKHPVYDKDWVELECVVLGARPAANVTWYNGTTHLKESSHLLTLEEDGTYDTTSRLTFTASRFENEQSLSCEASNEVMREKNEDPMRETIALEVMFPPIVTVSPANITVNESTDVLMFCQYVANPATLKSVKWLRDGVELDVAGDHYEGGTTEQTSLLIKNASREDMGNYTCFLANEVGGMPSHNAVQVSIHYKPETRVTLDPPSPVIASLETNMTLSCEVEAGNPPVLSHVKWFLDGESVASLPNCTNTTYCGLNPSRVFLDGVTTSFHGNWTCIGKNDAGWGPLSPSTLLEVYYPPSGVGLHHSPELVVKDRPMTLHCTVKDLGRPANTTFRWTRGGVEVPDVTTANYTVTSVTLAAETNFTCTAVNLGGESEPATHFIEVHAPPTFIRRLPPYYGALMSSENINLTCRVECSPICSILWQRNGQRLDAQPRYVIEDISIPPDTRTNDLQSVQSTLRWNMSSWPGGQLDRLADNANYTCYSTGNAVGQGVRSTTFFGVEYPPENLTVSNKVVNVIEGNVPEKVLCHAKAFPEPSYQWRKEGETEIIVKGNALILNYPISRKIGGDYVCEAFNKHGNNTHKTFINVLFKPECGIVKKEVEGKVVLECTAIANPQEVDFSWRIKGENETVEDHIEKSVLRSVLTLESGVESSRTYLCFANNSVGVSIPCEMDVTGSLSWWGRLENENLLILLAIIAGIILMVIIICIIIIIICRRKRAADKYNNSMELEERENPEGHCNNNEPTEGRGKWPLRPGVLVHVNTNHSLLSKQSTLNESQESRAARIRSMFSPEQVDKIRSGTLPGVFGSKNGVVTFKRLEPPPDTGTLKVQRNLTPRDATVNKDNKNASPNDALLPPEGDKAFYENLPFHNMQSAPNKASRPPSRISSGYGSSRSQQKLPARKFLTVRPLGARTRLWPQFRSLRCSRTSEQPPVPAPRQFLSKPAQQTHVYQNVPVPLKGSHSTQEIPLKAPATPGMAQSPDPAGLSQAPNPPGISQALNRPGLSQAPNPPELSQAPNPPRLPQPHDPTASKLPPIPGSSQPLYPSGLTKAHSPSGLSQSPNLPGSSQPPYPPRPSKPPDSPGPSKPPDPPGPSKPPDPPGPSKPPDPPGISKPGTDPPRASKLPSIPGPSQSLHATKLSNPHEAEPDQHELSQAPNLPVISHPGGTLTPDLRESGPTKTPQPKKTLDSTRSSLEGTETKSTRVVPLNNKVPESPRHVIENERVENPNYVRRARARRKPAHHGSARDISGLPPREESFKYKTTPYSTRSGSPPLLGHHRAHIVPRNHAEYAFIKFHDVGKEIDV